jgi:3',5'-cyclic AMP phosphodiesterase CpdA
MPWQTSRIATTIVNPATVDDKIRLLWLTDPHVTANGGAAETSLRLAIRDCNDWRPDAMIQTGDLSFNNSAYLYRAMYDLMACRRPVLHVVGNHDEVEATPGTTNAGDMELWNGFNQAAPFCKATAIASGDSSWKLLVLALDDNFYDDDPDDPPPGNEPNHEPGDRLGHNGAWPSGGYWRQLTPAQLAWVAAALAENGDCDAVLIATHYPPSGVTLSDYADLADLLQADGRPAIGMCGHVHFDGTSYTLDSTDTLYTLTFYKCPAMLESGSWTRVTLSVSGGAIVVEEMEIQNYVDPGGWVINIPFTLPA